MHSLTNRLKAIIKKEEKVQNIIKEELATDYETLDEIEDEWSDDEELKKEERLPQKDIDVIRKEIEELEKFRDLAESITHNAKGNKLIKALKMGFAKAKELGAKEKALIFTESRRTQEYLYNLLSQTEYKNRIILFNGSNISAV